MLTNDYLNSSKEKDPVIVGILNVTPDSFSDGGKFIRPGTALRQVDRMVKEGANIIDVGGESTRPGSNPVPNEEQVKRVQPIIRAIRQHFGEIKVSIDTTSFLVAKVALNEGASIINDVSAGLNEPDILNLAAKNDALMILMHSQGKPKTMQDNPFYDDVLTEVIAFLDKRIDIAITKGIKRHNIIIDPGIGFGKRKQDNLKLLANLDKFVALGYPVLLGTSRKRFMGSMLDVSVPSELVTATAVTTALGVMAGVKYFRVHDILDNAQAAKIAWGIKQSL